MCKIIILNDLIVMKTLFYIIPEETFGDYYDKDDFEEVEERVGE